MIFSVSVLFSCAVYAELNFAQTALNLKLDDYSTVADLQGIVAKSSVFENSERLDQMIESVNNGQVSTVSNSQSFKLVFFPCIIVERKQEATRQGLFETV